MGDTTAKENYEKEAMLRCVAEEELKALNEERNKVKGKNDSQENQNKITAQDLAKLKEKRERDSKPQQLNCQGYAASYFKKNIVCLKKKLYSSVPKYLPNKLKIKAIKQ